MKMLSSEARSLLDKLYNLRGDDSVILTKMNKEREEAIETQERTKVEKGILLEEIEKLTKEESTLADEGNKLISILSSINRDDFATVLERLSIDFDPEGINNKVSKLLPETVEKVVSEKEKATEKLNSVELEMNNAVTLVEELGIRKDEAISNQSKLNEFFDMALNGNINITRDEITSLLEKFNFSPDEQREAAKILMFPEDALYEYDANLKSGERPGKSITDVLIEAKQGFQIDNVENIEDAVEKIKEEKDEVVEPQVIEPISSLTDIFDRMLEENTITTSNEKTEEKVEVEEVVEEPKESEKEKLERILSEVGLGAKEFSAKNYEKLLENYEEDLLRKNIDILNNNEIDVKILRNNIEILYDRELQEKLDKLFNIGKVARDICLTPDVLVKYDLRGLNNTINVLQISGLDPKKVPLMAY